MAKHIRQPPASRLCGQCCVAMSAGVELKEVTKVLGTRGTTTVAILWALSYFGVRHSGKLRRIGQFMEIFGPIIRDHPFVNNELHFHGESYVRTD